MAEGKWVNVPGKGKRWQQPSGELMMTQPGFGPGQFFQTRVGEILSPVKNFISPPGYVSRGPFGSRPAAAATMPASVGFVGPTQDVYEQPGVGFFDRRSGRFLSAGSPSTPPATPVVTSAGVVQHGAVVMGLTPSGTVDRTQSDEYKSQLAQYQNLIKEQKQQEAEDLGMKIWMEKYAKTPMAQAGGAIGAYNPLLAATFPETKGLASTFAAPEEEIQMGDLGTRAQGELGPTMETLNPLASQAAQQEATATQADMATTAGLSAGDRARNLTRAFRLGLI